MHAIFKFERGLYGWRWDSTFPYYSVQFHFRYAKCLVESVGLPTLREDKVRQLSLLVEQDWRKVATFFMLRLAMAPCVESLILLDRAIFLTELNTTAVRLTTHKPVQVHLVPIFDPRLSPRNIALIASRISHNAK